MLPTPKTRRLVPFLLTVCALFFIVRDPAKAADVATTAFNGLMTVADALAAFAGALG
ncbi:hypothetical protein [Planomonospora sp. ID82291]|uniref:hypothetical protein n=1 Tax=Planomonospora sp. ID82291 TaxID=2738136 RepID=UPI0018C383D5|nr:hypothetical protein [Planomonospora sp. ID82291]MBG0814163.1 hypothetical protein [Planomonospora sp. ID82291]